MKWPSTETLSNIKEANTPQKWSPGVCWSTKVNEQRSSAGGLVREERKKMAAYGMYHHPKKFRMRGKFIESTSQLHLYLLIFQKNVSYSDSLITLS